MLQKTLKFVRDELNGHFGLISGNSNPEFVKMGNIALLDSVNDLENQIVMTLVNIEEDKILKNGPFHSEVGNTLKKHNPLIHLNLFVLFSATHSPDYGEGLTALSQVLTYFQGKFVFNSQNAPGLPDNVEKIIFDIHTMNFEYLNHLWGVLGGKYYPSILYKVRLVIIQSTEATEASRVETIVDKGISL